jgi:hypothetical protein
MGEESDSVVFCGKVVYFAIAYLPVVTALSLDQEERSGANRLRFYKISD